MNIFQYARRLLLGTLLALMGLIGLAHGQLIVIDASNGPGTDFVDLSGLNAAGDGDLVLVRSGTYTGFLPMIDGRGFTIQAEAGSNVIFNSGLAIQNLAAGQSMTLRGIQFNGIGLRLNDCTGPILFEECSVEGFGGLAAIDPVLVTRCDALILSRSSLGWVPNPQSESDTLTLLNSNLYLYDSTVTGLDLFGAGLSAIRATNSSIVLHGSSVLGGIGAPGTLAGPMGCTNGGAGGHGITLVGSSSVQQLNSSVRGGTGGSALLSACSDGTPGSDFIKMGSGAVTTIPGSSITMRVDSPVRSGASVERVFRAQPLDRAWILYTTASLTPSISNAFDGVLLLDPAGINIQFIGVLSSSGVLTDRLTAPTLVGMNSIEFNAQALIFSNLTSRFVLGTPSVVSILPAGF